MTNDVDHGVMTDTEILEEVAEAMAATPISENWVDYLPTYIDGEDRYAGDPWYIGTLDDGRTIWLHDESAKGADQYTICDPEGADRVEDPPDNGPMYDGPTPGHDDDCCCTMCS